MFRAPPLALVPLLLVCSPAWAGTAPGSRAVIPPGQEALIEALFSPWTSAAPVGDGRLVGISVDRDRIVLRLQEPDGRSASLTLRHRSAAAAGDLLFPSFAVRRSDPEVEAGPVAEKLLEALRANDRGDFPWRVIVSASPPPPTRVTEGPGGPAHTAPEVSREASGFGAWLLGTGAPLMVWLLLFGLWVRGGWHWLQAGAGRRPDPASVRQASLVIAIALLGVALRVFLAPEALYREAHPFRGVEAAWLPISTPVADSHYPMGLPALLQLLHALTGTHPVRLLFSTNLVLGCLLPIAAAFTGRALQGRGVAAPVYAALAALLPMAVKYAHSEVFTSAFATVLLLAIGAALRAARGSWPAVAAGLLAALLAHLRPEGLLAWPGLLLVGLAGWRLGRHRGETRDPRWLLVAAGVALVCALPALLRVATGGGGEAGISVAHHFIRRVPLTAPLTSLAAAAGRNLVDPGWNVFINPGFTPPAFLGLAVIGLGWLALRMRLFAAGLALIGLLLLLVYMPLQSTLLHFGEMRYHLSVAPCFLLLAGAGSVALIEVLQRRLRRPRWAAVLVGVGLAASAAPYAGLVRWAEHPLEQEYRVLRERWLDPEVEALLGAWFLFPDAEPEAFGPIRDVQPRAMAPMLADRSLEAQVGSWSDLPRLLSDPRGAPPIFLYRGLYLHYLAGPEGDPERTFVDRLRRVGAEPGGKLGLRMEPLFAEERPFLPHHAILDPPLGPGTFVVALYRVVRSEPAPGGGD